jgi:hypothetical protein
MWTPYLASYQQLKQLGETDAYVYIKTGTLPPLPITLQEFQNHLRIDIPLEITSYLTLIMQSAVNFFESYSAMTCLSTQWITYRNGFEAPAIDLRKGYFQSLQSFQYMDKTTLLFVSVDPTVYQVVPTSYFGQITKIIDQVYPYTNIAIRQNNVKISFTSGLALAPTDFAVSYPDLKMALLDHCAFLYANRGNAISGNNFANELPDFIREVYDRYKAPCLFGGVIAGMV